MEYIVKEGYCGTDLTQLNYIRKYLRVVTLADIATVDGNKIAHLAFACKEGNGLREDIEWPCVPSTLPQSFITLWKEAIRKCFLNPYSQSDRQLTYPFRLG